MKNHHALPQIRLESVIREAQVGFASGGRDLHGVIQVRMNNVSTEGRLDLSSVLRVPSTQKNIEKYYLAQGDVLFNSTNSPELVGKTALFKGHSEPVVFSNHFIRLQVDEAKIDAGYLARWLALQRNRGVFEAMCIRWVNQAAVRKDDLLALEIPFLPLNEQRRIAAILDKADAMRQLRRQSIAKLDTLLKAVFLEMFGDPVTNPKALPTKPIKDFGVVTTGNTPPRSNPEYYGSEIEWIKSDNINTPFHTLTVAEEWLSESGCRVGRIVPAGSILVTCIAGSRDCIGNAAMADRAVAFNQQINAITPNDGTNPYFLYTQILLSKRLIQRASTNSMKGMVSKSEFSEIKLLAPSKERQDQFGAWFERFHDLSRKHHKALRFQEDLFRALQQRAFAGKLFTEKAAAAAQQELFAD